MPKTGGPVVYAQTRRQAKEEEEKEILNLTVRFNIWKTKSHKMPLNSNGDTADDRQDQHYNKSKDYWEQVSPTVNGMLGGFENVTNIGEFGLIVLWYVD